MQNMIACLGKAINVIKVQNRKVCSMLVILLCFYYDEIKSAELNLLPSKIVTTLSNSNEGKT